MNPSTRCCGASRQAIADEQVTRTKYQGRVVLAGHTRAIDRESDARHVFNSQVGPPRATTLEPKIEKNLVDIVRFKLLNPNDSTHFLSPQLTSNKNNSRRGPLFQLFYCQFFDLRDFFHCFSPSTFGAVDWLCGILQGAQIQTIPRTATPPRKDSHRDMTLLFHVQTLSSPTSSAAS